ncbi:S-methyl-5-thioribose-1-phosphate isomerase [Microgenomates group bacterium RBG_16_45_19]|nr:MAG: S-methyl-5-thioribose-1-phosphate isomerase [Microgenomates group bacterium RBG_16_45_19]
MRTIEWRNGTVQTIDQTRLPTETVLIRLKTCDEVVDAIRTMRIRGAPLLGASAAFALALTAYNSHAKTVERLIQELKESGEKIRRTRPTAVNLFWALDRILNKVETFRGDVNDLATFVIEEANRIADDDVQANHLIGKHGAELIKNGDTVLTHCNAGALATVDYGTALGVVRAATEQGKHVKVFADETRPLLQGARLTAYELMRDDIPVTLITDDMAGYVMSKRMVNMVIIGADRIVRDAVINKIGTYTVAVLAREHNIPFYVAAPKSTFDMSKVSSEVVIEERDPEEVTRINSKRIAPADVNVFNPAFDITPIDYVTAIICEDGILRKQDFSKLTT